MSVFVYIFAVVVLAAFVIGVKAYYDYRAEIERLEHDLRMAREETSREVYEREMERERD